MRRVCKIDPDVHDQKAFFVLSSLYLARLALVEITHLTHGHAERSRISTDNAEGIREFQPGVVATPGMKCSLKVKL